MTKIIAFSGRKQSGKGSCCEFLQKHKDTIFHDLPCVTIKKYSMAGKLKQVCHEVLGLTHEQCYGSDADKNTLTSYQWENMPHYTSILQDAMTHGHPSFRNPPTGLMTARQILQDVGTQIFRKMNPNVWHQACLGEIKRDNLDVAVIDDVRFLDELDAVQQAGGIVVRLTRAPFKQDEHVSETSLDGQDERFDVYVDNERLSLKEGVIEMMEQLEYIQAIPKILRNSSMWKELNRK